MEIQIPCEKKARSITYTTTQLRISVQNAYFLSNTFPMFHIIPEPENMKKHRIPIYQVCEYTIPPLEDGGTVC